MRLHTLFAIVFIAVQLVSTGDEDKKRPEKANKAGKAANRATGVPYATRPDVLDAAADMAQRRDLDAAWVRQALAQARRLPLVQRLVLPPPVGTPKNWRAYRVRFI